MTPAKVPNHPLAVVAVVLSACGIVPLPMVGGLLGSLLGAVTLVALAGDPTRGSGLARAAVGIGAVTGILPFVTLSLVRHDDWGTWPVVLAIAHVALVGALVAGGQARGRQAVARGAAGAAAGVAGALTVVAMAVAGVLAVTALLVFIVESIFSGGS